MSDISIKRGNDKTLAISVTRDSAAVDITGWVFTMAVKEKPDDSNATAVIPVKTATITDAANGLASFTIDAEDTKTKKVGSYYFDILIKDENDKLQSSQTGTFRINQEITDEE